MLTLIHAADFHLDAPFSALSPQQSQRRREEQRALLERLADLCQREEAQIVLLAGDLLDSDHAYYETTQALSRALGRIPAPVFIAPGNHDFFSARSPWAAAEWPENVHIFSSNAIQAVPLPALGCTVHGGAFTAPFRDESPLGGFAAPADGMIHLMCLHGDVDGKGRYGSLSTREIAASGLNYLALGHVHACSGLQRAEKVHWAYPGCPEGRGFDELGEKGVLRVVIDGERVQADFIPLAGRRYEILTVDLTDGEDPTRTLAAALPRNAGEDIYRVMLTGESGAEGLDLAALTTAAAPYFYSVTLRDRTGVRRDVWSRAGEDTLTGLFLREMKAKLEAAEDDETRAGLEQAVRFGLAALEDREDCYL